MKENGTKNDNGKPWLALIPPEAEWEEGKAYTDGKDKYGMYNYTEGLSVMRVMSGVRRHINLFLRGEDIDPDSKSKAHHLGCARAGLGMVLHLLVHKPELDDRYKSSQAGGDSIDSIKCQHETVMTEQGPDMLPSATCMNCKKKLDFADWTVDNIPEDNCCGKCHEK